MAGLPTLEQYLASLPNGLSSYPFAVAKASLVRALLVDAPCDVGVSSGLPPRLVELARSPPAANHWTSEVELWALSLGMYDLGFANRGGITRYTEWTYQRNRALLSGPLYRVLFAVASPDRLFSGAAHRYSAFHRGTVMSKLEASRGAGSFRLTTPANLLPELARAALSTAFKAALDLSGAKDAVVVGRAESAETTSFDATWR
jgi:hypothetical protein